MQTISHFVLVHGAWHGGWCWEKVVPLLHEKGYRARTPTLSGLGERRGRLSPSINLSTHIDDISRVFRDGNLRNVILVGHSYTGMVISGVAEVIPDRIARLIYLDAALPLDGQSVVDIAPAFSSLVREMDTPEGTVPIIPPPPPESFGIRDQDDIAWVKSLLTPMPYNTLTEKVRIGNPAASRIPVSYILCTTQFSPASESAHVAAFRRLKAAGQDCRKFDAPHDIMITHPQELVAMLIDCASKNVGC